MTATPRPLMTQADWRRRWGSIVPPATRGSALSQKHAEMLLAWIGVAALGTGCGVLVAFFSWNALFLCVSLVVCIFILRDFRIGVALLIVLMPISRSWIFPHAMLGVTGLNPFNLLLVGTLGSYLLRGLSGMRSGRFVAKPLFLLYIAPIICAGILGARHVGQIPAFILDSGIIEYDSAFGYLRDVMVKPLLMVIFALLVGAAAKHSEKPEKFIIPAAISIWVMSALVIGFVLLSGASLKEMSGSQSREFLSALGMHANELGRLYAAGYALLLFTWVETKDRRLNLALAASIASVAVALVFTFSRGAFLSFVLVNVLFLIWHRSAKTGILFGILGLAVLLALPDAVFDRMTTGFGRGFGSGTDAISAGRIEFLWRPLLPEVADSPFYGHGLGSILWSEAMRTGAGVTILPVDHPHNGYLQALLDMGMAGLLLLCAYYYHVWRGFRALAADMALSPVLRGAFLGSAAGLASLLLSYATDSRLTPGPEQTFLWFAIGLMYGITSKRAAGQAPGR